MHWHAQNVNDRKDGSQGSILRHGRAWLYAGETCWGAEWSFFPNWIVRFGLELQTGGEKDVMVSIGLGFLLLYLHVERLLPWRWLDRGWPRSTCIDVAVFSGELSFGVKLGAQDCCWPLEKGWEWSCRPIEWLLGRHVFSEETLSTTNARIPMPESAYVCVVSMVRATWKRPRWPLTRRVLRAEVTIPGGVPVPGKGTTSYNCGPDAIYSMTCPARDAHEGIAKVVESVLRQRATYPL